MTRKDSDGPMEPDDISFDSTPSTEGMGLDAITRSEIDMQIATAKRYPRDLVKVAANMTAMATIDEETAASCFYSLSRSSGDGGKSKVEGPSIRMAEIAFACYGNSRLATRSLGETEDGKFVRQLGCFHDVENNNFVALEVQRRITGKSGKRYGDDMVGVTRQAAAAISIRNAVLTGIPRALVRPAYLKAKDVALGKTKSLAIRTGEVMARLKKLSPVIDDARILSALGRTSLAQITWDDIESMIGFGTAIRDGVAPVEEIFPDPNKPKPEEANASAGAAGGPPSASDILGEAGVPADPSAQPQAGVSASAEASKPDPAPTAGDKGDQEEEPSLFGGGGGVSSQ